MDDKIDKALTALEGACCDLEELANAFRYLGEGLEDEGYQPESNFENYKAVWFCHRFPMYLSVYNILTANVPRIAKELQTTCEEIRTAI